MTTAKRDITSQVAVLLAGSAQPAPQTSQAVMLVSYAPPSSKKAETEQVAALVTRTAEGKTVPNTSQLVMLVAYNTGTPDQSRSRAWSFTLDGHTFYVLNLGQEGTFVYDTTTQQWAEFTTDGYGQWNFLNGTMWGNRIVGGDSIQPLVQELAPSAVLDDGWRDITHAVTGGVATRSRVGHSVEALRVAASVGAIDEVNGATLSMRFSDDNGNTWSQYFTVPLEQGNYSAELAYRSLGTFAAPGRIFEITDAGGLIRIDGCDVFIDNFDADDNQQTGQQQ